MKRFLFACFITTTLLLGSCKKILDTKPQDFITPETYFNKEADAVAALGAGWDMLTRQWMYAGFYQFRMLTSDDGWTALSAAFPANLGLTASDATAYPLRWNQMYATIQYCNILLENLPRVPMDESKRNIIRGEGLFLRAFIYFELVKDWGPVPMRLIPTAGPNDLNLAGSSIKDIYAQVLKDMTEAESLVPTTASGLYGGAGYAAKTTVQAMLARVCLNMAGEPLKDVSQYKAARDWALKVVESKEHSLNPDYTQVFKNYAAGIIDKKESLWEVDFNYVAGGSEHGFIGYLDGISGASTSFGTSVGQYKITRKLFISYGGTVAATKDLRRDWVCAPWVWKNLTTTGADADKTFYTATQIYLRQEAKFRLYFCPLPNAVTGQSPINFPIMRYADVLLMLAEADNYVNGGPTPTAYSSINQVRARAWGKLLPGATNLTENDLPPGLSKVAFLQEVQNERFRELAAEGLRKHDLIRWGIFIPAIQGLLADVTDPNPPAEANRSTTPGQPYANMIQLNKISTRDLLWPMPASEIQYNKLLIQNPGW